jgi:transcriptional regulator with XRE-family HTH domain
MIGISNSLITHYEKGTKKPSVETLAALSDALGVSADYLLGINAKNA